MAGHIFKCAICGELFKGERPSRCPKCGEKAFIHVQGAPLKRSCGCGGSCSGCSGCHQ